MPWFRWDKEMLNHGKRSSNFHNIPPGPRNPVGITWIGLDKKGIGIHGTDNPDLIGRSASHGCIRLANWDVGRLVAEVTSGITVQISEATEIFSQTARNNFRNRPEAEVAREI